MLMTSRPSQVIYTHACSHQNNIHQLKHPNYYYTDKQTDGLLTPVVKGIVVGHWSQDGQLSHEQINQGHHNLFGCSEGDDSLQRELIETFSHDASTIIDATQSGKLLIKYLAHMHRYVYCTCTDACSRDYFSAGGW